MLERRGTYDAVVVACISDHTAIAAAREVLDVPAVGILEASVFVALQTAPRFAIVTPARIDWKRTFCEDVFVIFEGAGYKYHEIRADSF